MTEPDGFVVTVDSDDRIHFLDWGGPAEDPSPTADPAAMPGVVLVHGLSQTAWIWTPVARRLRERARTIAMDLRGHGLSDAPTEDDAYDLPVLGEDVIAVAEGSGALDPEVAAGSRVVLAGHGFGAIVAAEAASGAGRPLCRTRPRRWRLGVAAGGDRHGRRRVPARARRAARGHGLARRVPRRSGGLRPEHVGRRPGSCGSGDRRRDPRRPGGPGDAAARPRGRRTRDVHVRPVRDTPRRGCPDHGPDGGRRRGADREPGRWTR